MIVPTNKVMKHADHKNPRRISQTGSNTEEKKWKSDMVTCIGVMMSHFVVMTSFTDF